MSTEQLRATHDPAPSGGSDARTTCVVFDIDDTLYLERSYVRSGFLAVGRFLEEHHGVSGAGERAWALFLAGHRSTTFDTIADEFDLPHEIVPELVRRYRAHDPVIAPLGDAAAAIATLRPVARLGAVSDGPLESQRAKAEALGLTSWSEATVLTAELGEGRGKPAPDAFLEIQRRIDGMAGYTYVGDNPAKDFVAPRRLGWRTVRVRRPGSLHEAVDSGDDVDVEMIDLRGLAELLVPPTSP